MRVIAIESLKDGVLRAYGEGELVKGQIPDMIPFNVHEITNPCIKLDSGKYVWGFECWWGETEKFEKKYGSGIKEKIIVDPNNVQPLKKQ
ncbi:conserved hypothetical protein [Tenacibaculum sp. 190524A02b]|uniref:Uncharacterized protein n=1 Tax=Tenacibaculum vairaonense TaxID=3137860 RepID=A0ABP1F8I3_9FLAO